MNVLALLYDAAKEYAATHDLEFIETTTGQNGYPQHLRPALRGFESEEAMTSAFGWVLAKVHKEIIEARQSGELTEDEAADLGNSVHAEYIIATRRAGWSLYNYISAYPEPFSLGDRGFVDVTPNTDNEIKYADETIQELSEQLLDFNEIDMRLQFARAIWKEAEQLKEGEAVVCPDDHYGDGDYVTREARDVWSYWEDSKEYAHAVMFSAS